MILYSECACAVLVTCTHWKEEAAAAAAAEGEAEAEAEAAVNDLRTSGPAYSMAIVDAMLLYSHYSSRRHEISSRVRACAVWGRTRTAGRRRWWRPRRRIGRAGVGELESRVAGPGIRSEGDLDGPVGSARDGIFRERVAALPEQHARAGEHRDPVVAVPGAEPREGYRREAALGGGNRPREVRVVCVVPHADAARSTARSCVCDAQGEETPQHHGAA